MDMQPNRQTPTGSAEIDLPALWQGWWRTFGINLPLSGAVRQNIDAALVDNGGQLSLVSFNTSQAGDVQLERQITEQVASYGRQLGWIIDALDVLISKSRPSGLTKADTEALDQVTKLRDAVEKAKEEASRDRIDSVLADIRRLRQDPKRNREELQQLRDALEGDTAL
jgi:hypothetical protein